MNPLSASLDRVALAAEQVGVPELARLSGVPYPTLAVWARRRWRNQSVEILERVVIAAEGVLSPAASE